MNSHTLNPYPPHYRMAFACSIFLYPPAYRLALRCAFPAGDFPGEDDGLTTFCVDPNNGLGLACPPVVHRLR